MKRLLKLIRKIEGSYRKWGLTGLFGFVSWLFRLFVEKTILSFEARASSWWPRIHLKPFQIAHYKAAVSYQQNEATLVTFIIFVDRHEKLIKNTVRSLINQSDPRWECFLCYPQTSGDDTQTLSNRIKDGRIKKYDTGSVTTPEMLVKEMIADIHGKWIVITQPGDTQDQRLVEHISHHSCDVLYWDEDIYKGPFTYAPFLKPCWSPELWVSVDLLRCAAFNRSRSLSLIRQNDGGFISSSIRQAKQITHIPLVLTHCKDATWDDPVIVNHHAANVKKYIETAGIQEPQVHISADGALTLSFKPDEGLVSIIIPTKDNLDLLKRCLESIHDTPDNTKYEIILVDDQSIAPGTLDYFSNIRKQFDNIRIITSEQPFNYSRACNIGARESKGKYLLFLNNDVEVKTANWLTGLVTFASLEGVGVVGAKLIYPNGKIQHAGIVLGLEGHASHLFMGSTGKSHTPIGSMEWYRDFSAVTGACMLVRRDVYLEVNGFDEAFELVFGDVDLCLRIRNKGYRVVYNPDVVLIHHEGKTRGKYHPGSDIKLGYKRFIKIIKSGDPYYHPLLSRAWRIPVVRKCWEQEPTERIESIIKFGWY